ncbi:ScyD/ScyE family protein [Tellurirhabdus bombi]|uniref:ScyD/ScyE family protein n=1 Tax=Tellurirhabdus bombi TaxID=2907205 RepID=UPI001F45B324|nr:ScyD/ScyE family protein [Tellurirhabdus bombi]
MRTLLIGILSLGMLFVISSCDDHREVPAPGQLQVTDFASGLRSPLGITFDNKGQAWVTEIGDPQVGGRVSLITPDGQRHTAITGFNAIIDPAEGPSGLNHLAYKDGFLYILHRVDRKLFKVNIASFKPGDQPLNAAQLESIDIGAYVLKYPFTEDTNDSNPYNLTFGTDGNSYVADAAANAILKITPSGNVSVFATIPGIQNPTPVGPPTIEAVPTGIVFDGQKFLVTTLLGFPFPAGKARIYQVDMAGKVSLYKEGFTSLVDIILGSDKNPLVLELADFGQGFTPNTGRVVRSAGGQNTPLLTDLNMPTAIEQTAKKTYFVVSMGDGKIKKVTY